MSCRRLFSALVLLSLVGCSPGLHFRQETVLGSLEDSQTQSRRVSITFEVWDDDQQITNLSRENFTIYEDGQPATSESLNEAGTSERRVPVVLLLDVSLSMYQADAVGALKEAADRFVRVLGENGFEVTMYRFASDIERIAGIEAIPDSFDESGGERWTSLYAAVSRGLHDREDAIIVVFSDGADNYSQNHGIAGLGVVEIDVLPRSEGGNGSQRVIHTIGFGNVESERDRQGVPGGQALQRLGRNGSFQFAGQPGALDTVFQDVANRIRNIYVFDYFSPNLTGLHTLVVEARVGNQTARSRQMTFGGSVSASSGPGGCSNTCQYANDGECDDGGPGSLYSVCAFGTDCNDCGVRPTPGARDTMPAAEAEALAGADAATASDAETMTRIHERYMHAAEGCSGGDDDQCTRVVRMLLLIIESDRYPAGEREMLRQEWMTGPLPPRLVPGFQEACQAGQQLACEILAAHPEVSTQGDASAEPAEEGTE